MREVVITGVGIVTPMGFDLQQVRAQYESGRSAIRLSPSSTPGRLRVSAYIDGDMTEGLPSNLVKMLDRTSVLALQASDAAMADAGLAAGAFDPWRMGTLIGCGSGPTETSYAAHESLLKKDTVAAMSLLKMLPNAPGSHISMRHGLHGECATLSVACASSAMAIGEGVRKVRAGHLDLVLAGGVEAPLAESSVRGWDAMRVMARPDPERPDAACRPYSRDRTGIVLGEGSVMYILEAEEHARARGARILARLAGYGTASDASHITLPNEAGQAASMRAALADAGLGAADIGYINSHGTATMQGDAVETRSMRAVLGDRAEQTPISSTKSIHGHLLGGSGAIEMLAALVALNDGVLAPTVNLDVPDPECDLDYIPNQARTGVRISAAMCNSFAFGGSNASLILTR